MFEITSFSFYEISMFICVNFVFPSPKAIDSNRTTEGGFLRSISQCTIWRLMPIAIDTDIDTTHLLACCMKSRLDLSSQIFKHQEKIIWISISFYLFFQVKIIVKEIQDYHFVDRKNFISRNLSNPMNEVLSLWMEKKKKKKKKGVVEESEGCEFETLISPSVSPVSNLARRGGRKEEE